MILADEILGRALQQSKAKPGSIEADRLNALVTLGFLSESLRQVRGKAGSLGGLRGVTHVVLRCNERRSCEEEAGDRRAQRFALWAPLSHVTRRCCNTSSEAPRMMQGVFVSI